MLPNLSDNWGTGLQLMVPELVEPAHVLARRHALLQLKQIESIRVSYSSEGVKGRYTVEVFTDTQACSTCNTQALPSVSSIESEESSGPCQRPTIRINREFYEFTDLRDEIFSAVHLAHQRKQCEFCEGILDWGVFGINPDGMLLPLLSGERVARKFTRFITDLLARTLGHSSANTQGSCSGRILVPQIVHAFLFGQPLTSASARSM